MVIKTYEQFGSSHSFEWQVNGITTGPIKNLLNNSRGKTSMTLKELYNDADQNIIAAGNRLNALCVGGTYIRLKHIKSNMELITHNEPITLFGAESGRRITIRTNKDIPIDYDSIVINVNVDDTLFVLSVEDDYLFTFIVPKVIVSAHDPYGEEDWDED